MKPIVTLTLNSSVDEQLDVDEAVPIRKLRTSEGLFFAGGGGINVSRVIKELGGSSIAVLTAGWMTGQFLRELVEAHGLLTRVVPISGRTRVSVTIFEQCSGQEFRFTPPGPVLDDAEWQRFLKAATSYDTNIIVATGSLPRGVPNNFYGQLAAKAKERGIRIILDTSGRALFDALKEGVYLVKPNLRELEHLVGRKAVTAEEQEAMCKEIIADGRAEVVALTLGDEGALLVTEDRIVRLPTPKVDAQSTVGAGDSFVGGLTLGLAGGWSLEDAFALGISCGAATVLTAGTELCHLEDIERFFEQITGYAMPRFG